MIFTNHHLVKIDLVNLNPAPKSVYFSSLSPCGLVIASFVYSGNIMLDKVKSIVEGSIRTTIKGLMIKFALIIVALIVLFYVVTGAFSYASDRYSCHSKWVDSSYESKYTLRGGCLVKRGPDWIPSEVFRIE